MSVVGRDRRPFRLESPEPESAPTMPDPRPHRCPGPYAAHPPSRRDFLRTAGNGFGMLGLSYLLQKDAAAASPKSVNPLAEIGRAHV